MTAVNKYAIETELAPKAIGAYSQAVVFDRFIFTSGQIGIDPETGFLVSENFEQQVIQVFKNLENILLAEKLSLDNIVKLTVYLTDLNNFDILNDLFSKIFKNEFPARSVVEVSKLPKDCKIEVEAICYK